MDYKNFKLNLVKLVVLLLCIGNLSACAYHSLFFPIDTREAKTLSVQLDQFSLTSFDGTPISVSLIKPKV